MRFSIRAIGKIKEKWMREGIEEYSKRLKPVAKMDVLESDEEKMPENPSAAVKGKVLEKEGEKLLRSIQDSGCVVLLVFGLGSAAVLGIITAILTGSALSFALAMRSGILGICFQCVLLPLYYKLGFQRAKFVYMLLCALIGGVTGFLSGSDSTWLTSLHLSATLWICSIVCLVLLPVSMRFSVQWMAEDRKSVV